jgi:U3 small nucleolar RNA-associated protein 14
LSSAKSAPLSAPLPLRTQDRLDRQAAYEQTKEEVQKWEPTMKRIREVRSFTHLTIKLTLF